jgi:hypothetical protein
MIIGGCVVVSSGQEGPGRRPQSAKRQRFMEQRGRRWSIMAAEVVDQLAEAILRLLGVPADEAARLAAIPVPEQGDWQVSSTFSPAGVGSAGTS